MSEEAHGPRIARVEADVSTIRTEMGGLKSDMSGLKSDMHNLSGILQRIDQGVNAAQSRAESRELAGRPNLVAVVSVLITLIVTLIGGSFMIGGQLARADERYKANIREMDQMHIVDRELSARDVAAPAL